jgi:Uma2 family endonuclease
MANMEAVRSRVMALDEFIRRSHEQGPFEWIDGEIVQLMPTVSGHAKYGKRLFLALLPFEQAGLGEVFQEATFVIAENPQWVQGSRIPDVMFVLVETLAAFAARFASPDDKPYILVPELAVEVVSPTDNYSDVLKKVKRYLKDGVLLVWVIDPQVKEVIVYRQGSKEQMTLSGDDILTAEPVLPGFQLKIAELFA